MDTEMEIVKPKAQALSKRPDKQFKTWLIGKLAEVAMAQQANPGSETLEYFAEMLSGFEAADLLTATSYFCHRQRETGETAFPSLPMFEGAIRTAKSKRLNAEREEQERLDVAIREKHRAEHPEEYVTMAEIFAAVEARRKKQA